jgi:hypothetical protein
VDRQGEFLAAVLANPINRTILDRGAALGVPDWWLTAGAVFQTVWNVLDGRNPTAGIKDYDVFYFDDADLSYAAEDAVIKTAARTFGDLPADVEVRNEARVHLWYEEHFGVPGARFTSTTDAIDHFASTTCCFGVTSSPTEGMKVYAPHGYDDLFTKRVRPNPRLAPRSVYESKAERWRQEWPALRVEPWPDIP